MRAMPCVELSVRRSTVEVQQRTCFLYQARRQQNIQRLGFLPRSSSVAVLFYYIMDPPHESFVGRRLLATALDAKKKEILCHYHPYQPPHTMTSPSSSSSSPPPPPSAQDLHGARRGLLKAIWQHTLAPRFQSKPMDLEGYFSERGVGSGSFCSSAGMSSSMAAAGGVGGVGSSICDNGGDNTSTTSNTLVEESSTSPNLTASETAYLEGLLKSDDLESIRRASLRLADKEIFPTAADGDFVNEEEEDMVCGDNSDEQAHYQDRSGSSLASGSTTRKSLQRRDSQVQQQLFELHEKTTIMPSVALRRISGAGNNGNPSAAASNRRKARFQSKPILPDGDDDDDDGSLLALDGGGEGAARLLRLDNSLTQDDESAVLAHASVVALEEEKSAKEQQAPRQSLDSTTLTGTVPNQEDDNDPMEHEVRQWNPLKDLNAWIDGSEGFEVDDDGHAEISSPTSNPFKILGTESDNFFCVSTICPSSSFLD